MMNKQKERKLNILLVRVSVCLFSLFQLLSGSLQIKRILQHDGGLFFFGNNAIPTSCTLKLPVKWGESKTDFEG